jgi:uncharacterized protein (TIGR03083 family)
VTAEAVTLDVGALVRAELTELADVLQGLPPEDWDTASLCEGWRVREVVAHVTMPAHRSSANVLLHLLRRRFRFNAMADRLARVDAQRPVADLLADLRSERMLEWRPPGGGAAGALVHATVHALDITVPLRIPRRLPAESVRVVLDNLTGQQSLAHFGVDVTGKELRADDLDWSYGSGSPAHADAQTLVLALSGRRPLPQASL